MSFTLINRSQAFPQITSSTTPCTITLIDLSITRITLKTHVAFGKWKRCRIMLRCCSEAWCYTAHACYRRSVAASSHDAGLFAPPPSRGFCKGSRCAAAVKQETAPHPPHTAQPLSSDRTDILQQVRNTSQLINITPSHTHPVLFAPQIMTGIIILLM